MKAFEEAENVFRLPVHNPFGVHPTNAYLLAGDRLALFDVGPAHRRTWEDLVAGLSYLGHTVEHVELVVLSHGHADHDGLAHRFTWAGIQIGRADLPKVADYTGHLDRYELAVRAILPGWGVDESTGEKIPQFFDWLRAAGGPVSWAEPLEDGQEIVGLDGPWTVVSLPGHTEGLIGLYRSRDRSLISSDQLLETVVPNPGPYTEGSRIIGNGMADYERSLHRLLDFEVDRVLPGHGASFGDCVGHVAHFLQQFELRLSQAEAVMEGATTVHDVARRLFPGCDPENSYHVFITHLEAASRLSVLVERERVVQVSGGEEGPVFYVRVGS